MRFCAVLATLAVVVPVKFSNAASATYKFTGAKLVINNGECLTKKDFITVTLEFKAPIQEGTCNTDAPTSMTISDRVNTMTFKPAYYNSTDFDLCKLSHGNTVDTWAVVGAPVSKSGSATFLLDLLNAEGSSDDAVQDYICSPYGTGSSGSPGKWTGP